MVFIIASMKAITQPTFTFPKYKNKTANPLNMEPRMCANLIPAMERGSVLEVLSLPKVKLYKTIIGAFFIVKIADKIRIKKERSIKDLI